MSDENEERVRTAYNAFRNGFSDPFKCPVPQWDLAPAWVRDVTVVAYLQGKLDNDHTSMLKEANEVLRSAHSIASRAGRETNWDAFEKRVAGVLEQQHPVLNKRALTSA